MIKLLSLIIFSLVAVSISAQTSPIAEFKLKGKHSYKQKLAEKWKVAQELIDEETGENIISATF